MSGRNYLKSIKKYGVAAVVWSICATMVAPPALLAQTLGALPGTPGGTLLGGTSGVIPGYPIMTNPTALQPIEPKQTPCPAPGGAGVQPVPPSPTTRPDAGLEDVSEAGTGGGPGPAPIPPGLLAPGVQQQAAGSAGMGSAALPGQSQTAGAHAGTSSLPEHPGLLSPIIQQQGDALAGHGRGLPGQSQAGAGGPFSIEEGFARFFILQGVTGRLKQFGYNFFDVQFSGFPSGMDTPVGPDFVLGPDDTLALHVWNVPDPNFNRSYIAPIERDGTIFIPQVGSIAVAGSTFSEVKKLIRARLGGLFKRFEMHLSMARLRTIKVYVVGEVVRPGAYEISSLATASHALYAACGPTRAGSLRAIQVVREGAVAAELDFYDFFLRGDRTQDIRLRSGDTILVPPIGPVVAVAGPVKRPAIYELKAATTLTRLIDLAGGLLPTADRRQVQIFRVEAGQHRVILDVELGDLLKQSKGRKDSGSTPSNPLANPPSGKSSSEPQPVIDPLIKDGDFVRVASVPTQIENAVSLTGAVRNPGPYEFRPGMRLLDLLTPEQMLVDSYRDRAELIRTDPVTYEPTVMTFSPERLFRGDTNENLPLQRLDKVMVPTQIRPPKIVRVSGEVKRPGVYTIETGERLSSVLTRAGGLRERAFPEGLILIRESVRRSQQAEVQKYLALQKQKLIAESASLASGAVGVSGPQASAAGQEQIALQLQLQALDQLVSRIQLGRVVVKMDSLESLEGSDEDIMLEQGDHLTVPQQPQTVSIIGAVRNPTSVVHHDGLAVDDYIHMAGNYTPDAQRGEVYILRANGSTDSSYVRVKAVKAGDTVVVPARIEPKTRPLPLWQAIASIVGSVALAAAGIAVIGR